MKARDSVGLTPWLAEFADAHREAEFEAREERVQLPGLRIAIGIVSFLILVTLVLDIQLFSRVNPRFLPPIVLARIIQVLGLAFAAWAPLRGYVRHAIGWSVFLGAILVSLGHQWVSYLIMAGSGRPIQSIWTALFALVCLTATILPMRFALAGAMAFVLPAIVFHSVIVPMPTRDLLHVFISLALVSGLGTVLSHRLNRWRRLEFAALEIERQTNALLASEVEEQARTADDLQAQASALEARLMTAQRLEAMGRLAGGVAHDLNNLLTPILGYTELAMNESKDRPEVTEMLAEVKRATGSAKELLAHLLAVGRRQKLTPTTFDMGDFVGEQEPNLRSLLREGISLRIHRDSRIPVTADRTQMMQVLANLVVNARDAMPKGGDIRIRITASDVDRRRAMELGVERCGRFAMVSVEDNGTGMDEETRARLFEPFFTTKANGMGNGLGLATVYGIIGQHQGAIQVESAVGRGTTFTLWLPSTDASETVSIDSVMPISLRGGDETLLVVDDDVVVRELLVRLLGRVGYSIIEAKSGEHALEIARAHQGPIHLMVCDVIMPGMRGPELWEHLRKQRPETRVLFVSGFASDSIEPKDDLKLLAKPFTRAEILGRIRELLDEKS